MEDEVKAEKRAAKRMRREARQGEQNGQQPLDVSSRKKEEEKG